MFVFFCVFFLSVVDNFRATEEKEKSSEKKIQK